MSRPLSTRIQSYLNVVALKRGIRHSVVLCALPAVTVSACRIFAFFVLSTSFYFRSSSNMNDECYEQLVNQTFLTFELMNCVSPPE